jgi:hypothetical protein
MSSHGETIFASFDVESDGDNPLTHSMVSLGVALFIESSNNIGQQSPFDTFYVTIRQQEGKDAQESTMNNFWSKRPLQWAHVTDNPDEPSEAMRKLAKWLRKYENRTMRWIASPAHFDWMFLKCYYECYGPSQKPSIGYECYDMASMIRAHCVENNLNPSTLKRSLSQDMPYTHNALDDAKYQGVVYMNMRVRLKQLRLLRPCFHAKRLRLQVDF